MPTERDIALFLQSSYYYPGINTYHFGKLYYRQLIKALFYYELLESFIGNQSVPCKRIRILFIFFRCSVLVCHMTVNNMAEFMEKTEPETISVLSSDSHPYNDF